MSIYPIDLSNITFNKEGFWSKVIKKDSDSCWPWIGCQDRQGRGGVRVTINGVVTGVRAARIMWYLTHETPPQHLHVLHDCDNCNCVNPNHLHLGTHRDNMREARERGLIRSGITHYKNKFNVEQQKEIVKRFNEGESSTQLARELAVSASTILRVVQKGNTCFQH